MRFHRLQVPAFGPFTNLDLRFSDQPCDLHVIFGANEAGKSSLLRAIRDLLFGIHTQSRDNFLHDYGALRISGEVRNCAGEKLIFQRRKGNKNTLLDASGQPLSDSALVPFLGGVDQAYFSAMFGLGTHELREGAQQLLRGEGDIGTALFSATMGGTPVQKIVNALQEEADRLFKGRASTTVSIRPAVSRYKELLRQCRDAIVNPEVWDRVETEFSEAGATRRKLESEIADLERTLKWISRCQDALPTVGLLLEEQHKLAQLPTLPDLASDFVPKARAAREEVRETQAVVQRLRDQIGQLRTQLKECHTAPAVLAEADSLDHLHQDLGAYRANQRSLAAFGAARAELEPAIRSGMKNLQLSGEFAALGDHRLSSPVRLFCEEAAELLTRELAEQAASAEKAADLLNQIEAQESELQALPEADLTPLREALAVAAEATDADRTFSAIETEVKRLTREAASQHRQLTGAPADLDATAALAIPAAASIRRFQERMESIRRDVKTEEDAIRDATKNAGAIKLDLDRLQRQGELPSEDALRLAREHRDHGWSLVLAEWKGTGANEELVPGSPLEEAFPMAIAKADQVADRLRLHAEAVAQAEEKRQQLGQLEQEAGDASRRIEKLQATLDDCDQSWHAEWAVCGVSPRSPEEMLEWRDLWSEFRARLERLHAAQESRDRKFEQIQLARKRLAAVLGESDAKEFSLLFDAAKQRVQKAEQSAGRRIAEAKALARLQAERDRIEKRRAPLTEAVQAARKKWESQCAAVGLPEGTSPDAGLKLLGERKDLLAQFDKWQELSTKSELAAEAIRHFEGIVDTKARALEIVGDTTEARETALWKALTVARQVQARHDQLAAQIEKAGNDLEEAEVRAARADESLNVLLQLADLRSVDELEPLLAHLEQRQAVQAQIDSLRHTLGGLARGQTVDDFVSKVRAEKPDDFEQRKSAAEHDRLEKETALTGIRETLFKFGEEKRHLEQAGDAAAAFRQEAESSASAMRKDAARFLRLRLATHLLQSQIERFRKENQGPLLQKSGDVFRAITRGAFGGLGAEFNADDVPVLVGVRPEGTKVPVEGLSDGTRDQLFLALRLAALERHLEEHEPMPLILDDLLITFDDERTMAILPSLAALAKRTQIFLFTHHEHLLGHCRQTLGEGQFHLHRLGNAV